MPRNFKRVPKDVLENLIGKSFSHIKVKANEKKRNLFLRIFIGMVAHYFYNNPDNLIEVGFVQFKKNPEKKELFAVELIPNEEVGVVNAETLYKYYVGDLGSEDLLKEIMENFVNELLTYSQVQSEKITVLTREMQGRRSENDIQKN